MKAPAGVIRDLRAFLNSKAGLTTLVLLHSAVTCLSLIEVATFQLSIDFDPRRLWIAVIVATGFSLLSLAFVSARFCFGYFTGFYFYTMILGFLWINVFSVYDYPHLLAGVSAAVAFVLFLMPVLLIRAPLRQFAPLSHSGFERLLTLILAISIATIAVAATYNLRLVSISRIYEFRDTLQFPLALRYLLGWVSNALLPFAFASYWLLGHRWRAGLVLALLLLLYPVTLTKFAFFTPAWLIVLVILSRLLEARAAAIASLLIPMLIGLLVIWLTEASLRSIPGRYFDIVNIRMMATASGALELYNHFFASHPLTWFCQISVLNPLTHCPYQEQLSVVMQNEYGFGQLNASLFATEGIASVGPYLAPLTALISGCVLAFGNRASAGLPPRFVLLSAGTLPHILLNVPLSVALVTHGMFLLFVLWCLVPRSLFAQKD